MRKVWPIVRRGPQPSTQTARPLASPSAAEPGLGGSLPDTAFHHLQTQKSPKWLLSGSPLLLTATNGPSHGNVTAGHTLQIGNENHPPYNKELPRVTIVTGFPVGRNLCDSPMGSETAALRVPREHIAALPSLPGRGWSGGTDTPASRACSAGLGFPVQEEGFAALEHSGEPHGGLRIRFLAA